MASNKQDYAAMASQLLPSQAVEVLNDRMREVGKLNTTIADWLQERRKIEEQYSAALRRLARKQLEDVDLGVFSVPWSAIASSAETLADSHAALASKIDVDVERPLRVFTSSSRELQGMTTIQGNLASLAKDVDRSRAKLDRLKDKGADVNKISDAERELSNANAQWESQAPYVFEHLQTADEARLNHLRDVLTQFQTHEVDQVEKDRGSAEHCLNILLQVETTDEIKTYVLKILSNAPSAGSMRASLSTPIRPSSSNNLTPSRSQAENESQRSNSVQEDKRKSRFGGLKRLGTVVGKRDSKKRESKLPQGLTSTPEASEKSSKPPFNSLAGRFGRHNKDAPTLEPPREEELDQDVLPTPRPTSPLRINNATRDGPIEENNTGPQTLSLQQLNNNNDRHGNQLQQTSDFQNGFSALDSPKPSQPTPNLTPSRGNVDRSDATHEADRPYTIEDAFAPSTDSAGPAFNVNIRDAPVQVASPHEADAALASVAGRLQAPPVASRSSTIRGRRAARNSMATSAYYPSEEIDLATPEPAVIPTAAPVYIVPQPAPVALEQPPVPSSEPIGVNSRSAPSEIGEFAATGVSGNATSAELPIETSTAPAIAALAAAPVAQGTSLGQRPASRSAILPAHTGDNNSIRSGVSAASQTLKHGELNEIGLNSSVLETVNVRLENGSVVSSSLTGEIVLAYTPADFSSPFGAETIRLSNFSQLERVVPNPAFVNQAPSGIQGEYSVNLAGISRPQVAFKYQAHPSDAAVCAPLIITTATKIEASQTSVIISYSLNPGFDIGENASIKLSNVMLGLSLEGAVANGCQSRPVGTFSREKGLIFWQLGDLNLSRGVAPEKLLARFATESQATGGSVEARWEIAGPQAFNIGSGLTVAVQSNGDPAQSDPFADESVAGASSWKPAKGPRRIITGQYIAK